MLKFWAISAIAAFCLKGVVSIDVGIFPVGQPGPGNPFNIPGGIGIPSTPTERVNDPKQSVPLPHIGDDKIRIACTTYLLIDILFIHLIAASN